MYRLRKLFSFFNDSRNSLYKTVHNITGLRPVKLYLYETAFRHRSMDQDSRENNERLEFLGDSVLNTVISEYLFLKYPFENEGFLTQLRSKIVSRRQLNHVGKKLNLTDYLSVRIESKETPYSVHGNTFEAFVGAVYLDHGYKKTKRFIKSRILQDLLDIEEIEKTEYDFKSKLHQFAQKENLDLHFDVVSEEKVNGKIFFRMQAEIGSLGKFSGQGFSKKSAEQDASLKACQSLNLLDN